MSDERAAEPAKRAETFRELMARDAAKASSKLRALIAAGKSGPQIAKVLGPVDVRTCRRWASDLRAAGHDVPELPRGPRVRRRVSGEAKIERGERGKVPTRARGVLQALKNGGTQAEVADRLGVSRQYVHAVASRAS